MSAILNLLNSINFLIVQPILMTLVSKLLVYRAISDKTYLLLVLRSPLKVSNNVVSADVNVVSKYLKPLLRSIKSRYLIKKLAWARLHVWKRHCNSDVS